MKRESNAKCYIERRYRRKMNAIISRACARGEKQYTLSTHNRFVIFGKFPRANFLGAGNGRDQFLVSRSRLRGYGEQAQEELES